MHFFNPAPILPLVEVVSGLATDASVSECIYDTARAWGKVPVHAASTPGFIVNRCARPFYGEGLRIAAEGGASYATIDAVMRESGGFRMGPFELVDLIGLDVNYAVTRSVWEAYYHDARYAPSLAQQELVAAGFFGRKTGRGFYDYAATAQKPLPHTEVARPAPVGVRLAGEGFAAVALAHRLRANGVEVSQAATHSRKGMSCLLVGDAAVALTDGRTATAVSATSGQRNCVVFDLAFDHATCGRIAAARSDTCSEAAWAAAAGMFQAAGMAVSRVDDTAGLVVMRTVAMLANEAADAVTQGIATARDVDLAMCSGVNYPRGPLAWADAIGVSQVVTVLHHLQQHYGDPRYRTSPLLSRRAASGSALRDDA
jgi:3-hydroxybutyryl-CoA dehydrogenase